MAKSFIKEIDGRMDALGNAYSDFSLFYSHDIIATDETVLWGRTIKKLKGDPQAKKEMLLYLEAFAAGLKALEKELKEHPFRETFLAATGDRPND